MMPVRLASLDYLRGLCALGIMFYHFKQWTWGTQPADTLAGKVGIYAVSLFYVLSGLTLYHVYKNNFTLKQYFVKRFWRIYPLYWLAIVLMLILKLQVPGIKALILNFTGLLPLLKYDQHILRVGWSVGCEIFFYLLFPVLLHTSKYKKVIFALIVTISLLIYLWFAFYNLNSGNKLFNQWDKYSNPFNQLFLFVGGCLTGIISNHINKPSDKLAKILLLAACAVFVFYPENGNQILLVTGLNRVLLTVLCFVICYGFYNTEFVLPTIVKRFFALIGESSYSLYLLHPVIWYIVKHIVNILSTKTNIQIPVSACFLVTAILSIVVAKIAYEDFEKYFIGIGKRKTSV